MGNAGKRIKGLALARARVHLTQLGVFSNRYLNHAGADSPC